MKLETIPFSGHPTRRRYFLIFAGIFITILPLSKADAQISRLQQAIAMCDVESARKLIDAGAEVNALDFRGQPILKWLASGMRCTDAAALETAKLLDAHGAKFENLLQTPGVTLLVNLAPRRLPNTIAFLAQKKGSGDPTQALQAIARRGDIETLRVLLSAGADPQSGPALGSSLFDASASGQAASVREMLKHIENKQSPKVLAAYKIALAKGSRETTQSFLDAGMSPPQEPIAVENPCARKPLTFSQARLLARLGIPNARGLAGLAGPMTCAFIQECGDLILIDCNSAADGPAYYIDQKTAKILATCGGACMLGCKGCPPNGWTCGCKY